MSTTTSQKHYGLPELIFFVGSILALSGGFSYLSSKNETASQASTGNISPSVIERKLSIEEAQRSGQKTYQFKTNFIPGIGIITDPQAYQDQWQKSMEEKE